MNCHVITSQIAKQNNDPSAIFMQLKKNTGFILSAVLNNREESNSNNYHEIVETIFDCFGI